MMIQLNEIFCSPQGEGTWSGIPTVFVRFFGCNISRKSCPWCDQPNALEDRGRPLTYELDSYEVAQTISQYPKEVPVCFTGGEPTAQHQGLIEVLKSLAELEPSDMYMNPGRLITIETNGTIYVPELCRPDVFLSISPKFTNVFFNGALSAHGEDAIKNWLKAMCPGPDDGNLTVRLHLKFVVETRQHAEGIFKWLERVAPKSRREQIDVYLQPEYSKGRSEFTLLIKELCTPEKWPRVAGMGFRSVRFSSQAHKEWHVR